MNLRHFLAGLLAIPTFAALLPVVACDSAAAKVECCPIDEPSCNCTDMGGTPAADGTCRPGLCDAPPPMFKRYIDENGCPALKTVPYDGVDCNAPRDAGYDAGQDAQPDAPASDAQPDAIADARDADAATTDAGAP
jgi:hypothetical protein